MTMHRRSQCIIEAPSESPARYQASWLNFMLNMAIITTLIFVASAAWIQAGSVGH